MSDIKIIITGDESGLNKATNQATADLGRIAIAAQKTDSSLAKMGGGMSGIGTIAQKTASSIGSLAGSLISGGLITAVAAAGLALFELGKKLFDVSAAQKRFNEVLEGAKSAYVKAVLDVEKMSDAFDKAKKGIISKEKALSIYNNTIGLVIGQTNDLKTAENNFIANAENYIKYTLYKAAANIALEKAADAAFKAEMERIKGTKDVTALQKAGTIRLNFAALSSLDFKNAFFTQTDEQIVSDKIQKFTDVQKIFKEVYDGLIAKSKEFKFVEIENNDAVIKSIKAKTEAQKEYRTSLLPQETGERGLLSRASGSTLTPTVVVKPKIFIEQDNDAFFKALEAFFDRERIAALSQEFSEMIAASIKDITENSLSSLGEALGEALADGKDVIPNLFGKLMNNVGQQVQELGKFLIKSAITVKIAKDAFKKLLANPVAAIAVGIGLIALGAILKQQASKQFQGFASGTTGVNQGGIYDVGERGPERIFLPAGAKVQPNNELNAFNGGNQIFIPAVTLSGPDLVIAFNRASQMMNRNN